MATTSKSLFDGVLTASLANTYVAPLLTTGVVKAATFCNDTAAVVTLNISVITSAGGTARVVVKDRNLAATETYFASELINVVVEAGGAIQASGLDIDVVISGVELV